MATTYELCGPEVTSLLAIVKSQHQKALEDAGVTIDAMFADAKGEPAIKVRGYPAAAKISVTSLQDRVRGIADAKLLIDREAWSRLSESRRIALLDHELEHLDPVIDALGLVLDDLGRPKLRMRPHDFEMGFFESVYKRHGEASMENAAISEFQDRYGRQLLLFAGREPEADVHAREKPSIHAQPHGQDG